MGDGILYVYRMRQDNRVSQRIRTIQRTGYIKESTIKVCRRKQPEAKAIHKQQNGVDIHEKLIKNV